MSGALAGRSDNLSDYHGDEFQPRTGVTHRSVMGE